MADQATQPVEPQHSPEPWVTDGVFEDRSVDCGTWLKAADGSLVAIATHHNHDDSDGFRSSPSHAVGQANIRRIIAAVNFCREFSTQFLESHRLLFHPGPSLPGECKALIPIALNDPQPSAPQGATS